MEAFNEMTTLAQGREFLKIEYNKLEEKDIEEHIKDLYSEINTLEDAKKLTSWMPKK